MALMACCWLFLAAAEYDELWQEFVKHGGLSFATSLVKDNIYLASGAQASSASEPAHCTMHANSCSLLVHGHAICLCLTQVGLINNCLLHLWSSAGPQERLNMDVFAW